MANAVNSRLAEDYSLPDNDTGERRCCIFRAEVPMWLDPEGIWDMPPE